VCDLVGVELVEVISLNFEGLSGHLAPELVSLSSLRRLYLRGNPISGTIPRAWDAFTRLDKLDMALMNLSSNSLPPALATHVAAHREAGNTWSFQHDVDVDCQGSWSECTDFCVKEYTIRTEASGAGQPCVEARHGATLRPGRGPLPAAPTGGAPAIHRRPPRPRDEHRSLIWGLGTEPSGRCGSNYVYSCR
jgi:hypothetical protein